MKFREQRSAVLTSRDAFSLMSRLQVKGMDFGVGMMWSPNSAWLLINYVFLGN